MLAALSGCTQVPELADRTPPGLADADYPRLIPLDRVLGPPPDPVQDSETLARSLNARRDALRARARRLAIQQTEISDGD